MPLSIIVVNFNTKDLLRDCLITVFKSLATSFPGEYELIVVDNGSNDNSPQMIKKEFPQVNLIENKENVGFGRANNQAIKRAKGDYILLLNSDTIVSPNSIVMVVRWLRSHPEVGVVGCRLLNKDSTIQPSAGFFPNILRLFLWATFIDDLPGAWSIIKPYHVTQRAFYQKEREVDWVTGAFFMLRKEILERVGLFDEKMFMYVEEMELCYRIKKRGFKIYFTPVASAIHLKGGSQKDKNLAIVEEYRGLRYFFKKHKPQWQRPLLGLILRLGALLRIILFGIIGQDKNKKNVYTEAFKMAG